MTSTSLPRFALEPAWYDAIAQRTSRRRFDGTPVRADAIEQISAACQLVSEPQDGVRAVLVDKAPDGVFTGLVGNYGAIVGATAFIAFVGPADSDVEIGYVGEAAILAATAAGIETCWIAGSFDRDAAGAFVELAEGEQVRAVTPLGHAPEQVRGGERLLHAFVRPRRRLDLEVIAPGVRQWPQWARAAAEAVRLAPSGVNRQPWRLRMDGEALVVSCVAESRYWTARMDCGIACLHAELGAMHAGVSGAWAMLPEPDIARFTPA